MEAAAAGAVGGGIGDLLLWAPDPSTSQAVGVPPLPGRKGDPGPAPQAVTVLAVCPSPAVCQHEGHVRRALSLACVTPPGPAASGQR